MGIVTIQGVGIGGFSPFTPWTNVVATEAARCHIQLLGGYFFLFNIVLAPIIALPAFFYFGGAELFRRASSLQTSAQQAMTIPNIPSPFTCYQFASLVAMCAFVAMVLMKFDIGMAAFAIGLVLDRMFRGSSPKAIAKLPWNIAIMIAGVLMYVGLLKVLGVLRIIGDFLVSLQRPSLVRVGISYLGTIIANFESSSIGVLGIVIPVAIKSMGSGSPALVVAMRLALLSGSIVAITASPFHIGGALVLAEVDGDERTFRDLLIWVVCLAAILPLLAFLF